MFRSRSEIKSTAAGRPEKLGLNSCSGDTVIEIGRPICLEIRIVSPLRGTTEFARITAPDYAGRTDLQKTNPVTPYAKSEWVCHPVR